MSTNQFVVRNTSCDSLLFFLRLVCCTDYAVSIILEKSNGDILLVCLPFYHRHCFISPLLPLPATSGNQTCFNLISVLMEADWRGLTMSSIKQSFPNHWTWQTSLNSWWLLVAKTTFGDHCCRKCGSRDLQIAKWLRTICTQFHSIVWSISLDRIHLNLSQRSFTIHPRAGRDWLNNPCIKSTSSNMLRSILSFLGMSA